MFVDAKVMAALGPPRIGSVPKRKPLETPDRIGTYERKAEGEKRVKGLEPSTFTLAT
jgi:hypothetical protein